VNIYHKSTNILRPSFDFAMFRVPDGTVKDQIDWNVPDSEQKQFYFLRPKATKVPEVSTADKIALTEGKSKTITIPGHDHTLNLRIYNSRFYCDICKSPIDDVGYQCPIAACDYDCCLKCANTLESIHTALLL